MVKSKKDLFEEAIDLLREYDKDFETRKAEEDM